jgi:hypothetical protein
MEGVKSEFGIPCLTVHFANARPEILTSLGYHLSDYFSFNYYAASIETF